MLLSATDWVAMGPFASLSGQTENVQIDGFDLSFAGDGSAEKPVIGAVNVVLPHPTNPDVLFDVLFIRCGQRRRVAIHECDIAVLHLGTDHRLRPIALDRSAGVRFGRSFREHIGCWHRPQQ